MTISLVKLRTSIAVAILLVLMNSLTSSLSNDESEDDKICSTICSCDNGSLICIKKDKLTAFPRLNSEELTKTITAIRIENQSLFTTISSGDLHMYRRLRSLIITNSGLKEIDEDAFSYARDMNYLDLSDNHLRKVTLPMVRSMLHLNYLNLTGNIFNCDCDSKWLKTADIQLPTIGTFDANLACYMKETGRLKFFEAIQFPHCGYPVITVSPNFTDLENSTSQDIFTSVCHAADSLLSWYVPYNVNMSTEVLSESELQLTLTNILPGNRLEVSCLAENSVGKSAARWILADGVAPTILKLHKPYKAFYWVIGYEVAGQPLPELSWLRDGQPFDISERNHIENDIHPNSTEIIYGRLMFKINHHGMNGNYTLIASNMFGSDQQTIDAVFMVPPENGMAKEIEFPPYAINDTKPIWENEIEPANKIEELSDKIKIILPMATALIIIVLIGIATFFIYNRRSRQKKRHNIEHSISSDHGKFPPPVIAAASR